MVPVTEIVGIRIRLEAIDILNLVTRRLGKRTPNLTIQSNTIEEYTTITRRGGGTCLHHIIT